MAERDEKSRQQRLDADGGFLSGEVLGGVADAI